MQKTVKEEEKYLFTQRTVCYPTVGDKNIHLNCRSTGTFPKDYPLLSLELGHIKSRRANG